jgi:hypothetical protein
MANTGRFVTATADQVSVYMDATLMILRMHLLPHSREEVAANLQRLLRMGQQIMSYPLPDGTSVAPVFIP